jgi:hypothetical protein
MVGMAFRWKTSARSLPDGIQSNLFSARTWRSTTLASNPNNLTGEETIQGPAGRRSSA